VGLNHNSGITRIVIVGLYHNSGNIPMSVWEFDMLQEFEILNFLPQY
jgi:hypothetical protein